MAREAFAGQQQNGLFRRSHCGCELTVPKIFDAQHGLHPGVDLSNLGFALASTGQYDRAERELCRSLELEHGNLKTQQLLDVVLANTPQPPDRHN